MGQSQSIQVQTPTEVKTPQPPAAEAAKCPVNTSTKKEEVSACPVKGDNPPQPAPVSSEKTECPVVYKNPNVYNVYNQKIDPKNQMPAQANQERAPGQAVDISKEREPSSIPKGGTDSTWLYPSPQMFWNALVRKNKIEGAIEEDMESVVRIHNSMNEATWLKVLEWEKLHPIEGEGREPRLLRFLGRPDELSPKAQLKTVVGHAAPFDRHDWIVDRGGVEVRYVIDYYHDEAAAPQDKTPQNKRDLSSIKSIKLDVRPALDSPQAFLDRLVIMPYYRFTGKSLFKPLPFFPESSTRIAERQQFEKMKNSWEVIRQNCSAERTRLQNCKSEQECANASIILQACTAGVVCPTIAKDFNDAVNAQPFDEEKTEKVYTSMVKCLELFEIDSRNAFSKGK